MDMKLKESCERFVEQRISENYKKIIKSQKHKSIASNYFKAFEQLEEELIDNRELLEQYEECEALFYNAQLKEAYKMGFRDSRRILAYEEIEI